MFVDALSDTLTNLPADFNRWDVLLNSIEFGLLRRREIRPDVSKAYSLNEMVIKIESCVLYSVMSQYTAFLFSCVD